jgi:hypothetical protein
MLPSEIKNKHILLSPLNWGMGHISRCIPLIDLFLKNGNTVFVAGEKDQQQILQQYFPKITYIDHEGYPFKFGSQGNFAMDLAKQFFPLKKRLKTELEEVDHLVDLHKIDIVISDHRYGFRSNKVHSIILSHQLNLPARRFEGLIQKMHYEFLHKYDEIWVPDTERSDYSGELSINKQGFNAHYIGCLSRFSLYTERVEKTIDEVIIVSGPMVYAKKFLEEQLMAVRPEGIKIVLIAPKQLLEGLKHDHIILQSSEDWLASDQQILRAKKIVARCGYSTLMDLIVLKVPFSITPTPGQREQEYLFELWYKKSLGNSNASV